MLTTSRNGMPETRIRYTNVSSIPIPCITWLAVTGRQGEYLGYFGTCTQAEHVRQEFLLSRCQRKVSSHSSPSQPNLTRLRAAKLIAEVATHANTPRLIHVSHLNATPDSSSVYYRTKYEGEKAVRNAFPEATIVRPGPIFGYEDWLLNAAAREFARDVMVSC
jgi:hypothetical protein